MTNILHYTVCPFEWCAAAPGRPCKDRRGIPLTYEHRARVAATDEARRADRAYEALREQAREEGAGR